MLLKDIILEKIQSSNGFILFRDFMQIALYHHKLGYYFTEKEKISFKGDFITSSYSTSLFARCFAKQFASIIAQLGNDCNIIEFGAGNGDFAIDCISELKRLEQLPKLYIIIELSNYLRFKQQEYIKKIIPDLYDKFLWLNGLPENKMKAIIFANELLDAMPVDIFVSKNNRIIQQGVIFSNNNFKFFDMPNNDTRFEYELEKILSDNITFIDNYTSEINTWIRPWINSLVDFLSQGVLFLCDYGYHRSLYYAKERYMGNLTCYYRHSINFEPFINIGSQDITSHIDFTTVTESALDVGFILNGYMKQIDFLKRSGIFDIFINDLAYLNTKQRLKYNNYIKELLFTNNLSEIFKVIVFSLNFNCILDIFNNKDNIEYLL